MRTRRLLFFALTLPLIAAWLIIRADFRTNASQTSLLPSPNFEPGILSTFGESELELRIFITTVKTDRGRIITGQNSDPVKSIVGAEPASLMIVELGLSS